MLRAVGVLLVLVISGEPDLQCVWDAINLDCGLHFFEGAWHGFPRARCCERGGFSHVHAALADLVQAIIVGIRRHGVQLSLGVEVEGTPMPCG